MDRREFLATSTLATLGIAFTLGCKGLDFLVPPSERVRSYSEYGWLETSLPGRPDLINSENGCKDYINYMCTHQPVLKTALKEAYIDFFYKTPKKHLGDIFTEHIKIAGKVLKDKFPEDFGKSEKLDLNHIVHVAMFTMSAVLSPYFSVKDIKDLGVPIELPQDANNTDIKWLKYLDPYLLKIMPANDQKLCKSVGDQLANCKGGDKVFHLMQHFFLVYQLQYCLNHKLKDAEGIPTQTEFVDMIVKIPELRTFLKDSAGGTYWEFLESIGYITKDKKGLDEFGNRIPQGFFDYFVKFDLIANHLGAVMGLILNMLPMNQKTVDFVTDLLNSPKLYEPVSDNFKPNHREIVYSKNNSAQHVNVFTRSADVSRLPLAV